VPLTADKGTWTPKASISYQWIVEGEPVSGATDRSFTPRPEDLGKHVVVEVTATRPGYLSASVPSPQTAATAAGVIRNHKAPVISGRAVVGHTLRTTDGTWSIPPDEVRYQWYAGRTPIAGASRSTYVVSSAEAGRRIHVVVTAVSAGYTSLSSKSGRTDRVVFGRVAFDKPTIRGHAVVGRALRAHVESVHPSTATPRYQWYRDHTRIAGAREKTYVVQTTDLRHRLHVVVTMRAENWTSRTRRSTAVAEIKAQPRLHLRTSIRSGRVHLAMGVRSHGLADAEGYARVWRGHHLVGRVSVVDGDGSKLLARMRRGTHTLRVVYRGGLQETIGRKSVTVTVP
jgi:hypothetical protein